MIGGSVDFFPKIHTTPLNQCFLLTFKLLQVKRDNSLFSWGTSKVDEDNVYITEYLEESFYPLSHGFLSDCRRFYFDPLIDTVHVRPKSLIQTLSEIGGLFFLMRLAGLFLSILHEYLFNRKMA